jgi:two-component system response regulator DesR
MGRPIRILLVEDNNVFREALELLFGLRADMEVVASVGDGAAAVPAAQQHRPDVVLMDYRLPGLDGVQATLAVREACPEVAVVCLTASANAREIESALRGRRGGLPDQGSGAGGHCWRNQARGRPRR